MLTLNKYSDHPNTSYMEINGKSTDEKPIKTFQGRLIGNGSTLFEMDTCTTYMYDEESHKWWKVV